MFRQECRNRPNSKFAFSIPSYRMNGDEAREQIWGNKFGASCMGSLFNGIIKQIVASIDVVRIVYCLNVYKVQRDLFISNMSTCSMVPHCRLRAVIILMLGNLHYTIVIFS